MYATGSAGGGVRESEATEDYCKAIHALADRHGGAVGTAELAERLGVTPGSASAMTRKLAERGFVEVEPLPRRRPHRPGPRARARGDPPPPAARALPRRAPRCPVGPRPRRGRAPRARPLGVPRGAHRRQARRPDPRPARRPDPDRRRPPARARRPGRCRSSSPARAGASAACRTPIPRCCATCPSAGSPRATTSRSLDKQPFGGPVVCRFGDAVHHLGGGLAAAMRVEIELARRSADGLVGPEDVLHRAGRPRRATRCP